MKFEDVEYPSELLSIINKLRIESELCDVILKVEDIDLPAHKIILAASCPYFSAMFNGHFPESYQKEIPIHGIDADSLHLMLNFFYTGCIEVTSDNAISLLSAACFLQIQWVQEKCCEFLEKSTDVTNCLRIRKFADRYSCKHLRNRATDFIIENFNRVSMTEDFLAIDISELEHFLDFESLYDNDEDDIFNAILRWIQDDPDERTTYLSGLLRYIHPLLVSQNLVNAAEILTTQPECATWKLQASGQASKFDCNIFILDKTSKVRNFYQYNMQQKNIMENVSLPEKLFGSSMCGEKNFLYVQGGSCGRKSTRSCFRYNIVRKRWMAFKSLLKPRSHHCTCILNSSLFTIGGTGLNGATDDIEYLDLSTEQQNLVAPMHNKRSSMGSVVHDGCLYVMGGENERESLYSLERYDPREGVWSVLACMEKVTSYCSSATVNNCIYCAEGLAPYMERYDFKTNSWELIKFKADREFYQLFSIQNELYGLSGEGIFKYDSATDWDNIYNFSELREWDAAVPMNVEVLRETSTNNYITYEYETEGKTET